MLIAFNNSEEQFLENHPMMRNLKTMRAAINWLLVILFVVCMLVSLPGIAWGGSRGLWSIAGVLVALILLLAFLARKDSVSYKAKKEELKNVLKKTTEYTERVIIPLRQELSQHVNLSDRKAITEKCMRLHRHEFIQEFPCFQELLGKIGIEVTLEQPTKSNPTIEHIFKCGHYSSKYETNPDYDY